MINQLPSNRWRLTNVVEMTLRMNNKSPIMSSEEPPVSNYFHYKIQYKIHEKNLTPNYNRRFANRDYIVTDDTKVVGYILNGYFFNFKSIYGE